MIDSHTHSEFSPDSTQNIEDIIKHAINLNMKYIAISDHIDNDYFEDENYNPNYIIDVDKYYNKLFELKEKYKNHIIVGIGAEFGYSKFAENSNKLLTDKYSFDSIINSVHTLNALDLYFPESFKDYDKNDIYKKYLLSILDSTNCTYKADIVGHIGYVTRNAPYEDKNLYYQDYVEIVDEILKSIIKNNSTLEINTRANSHNTLFVPSNEILERYFELGGENVSFGSDAHIKTDICNKFEDVRNYLLSHDINYLTYYIDRKPEKFSLK